MAKVVEETPVHHAPHGHANIGENVTPGEPGYGLGLAGFIVSFFVGLAGLIMSAIALRQSKKAGKRNGFALAGLIIGIVSTVFGLIVTVASALGVIFLINYCDAHPDSRECSDSADRGGSTYDRRYDDMQDPEDRTY